MEGEIIDFKNNYNLYEYFNKITLKKTDSNGLLLPNDEVLNGNAIIYKDKILTYNDLNRMVIKINNYLYEIIKKLDSEDKLDKNLRIIGIHLNPDEYTIPILMAIHSLSFSYLPIDPQLPNERMQYIIQDSKPLLIITNVSKENCKLESITSLNEKHVEIVHMEDVLATNESFELKNITDFDSNDTACVLYTSGSTGQPKGVCLTHLTIMNRIQWQWHAFPIDSSNQDIGVFKTSLNFVDHVAEIFAFILKGLKIIVIDSYLLSNPGKLINIFYEYKITYFILVPSLLRNILLYAKSENLFYKLSHIRRWVCSGEKLSVELLESFFDNLNSSSIVISNFYGSTEVTGDVTYVTFSSKQQMHELIYENSNVPIGIPIANSDILLYDENMNEIKEENVIGEIYACGLCLASGYLQNNGGLNDNKFVTISGRRLFKTGDFGFIRNSLLYYSGRHDSQIKIRGKRIDLNELEYYALKIQEIDSFIPLLYEINDENLINGCTVCGNRFIIAYYKSSNESNINNLDESQLNNLIREKLKLNVYDYMIPDYLIRLDEIPFLYNGKIDKQYLLKNFTENILKKQPDHKIEIKTESNQNGLDIGITSDLLKHIQNITGININLELIDNYKSLSLIELGINSLNAIEVYLSLNDKITFDEFISCNTLEDLISKLSGKSQSKSVSDMSQFDNSLLNMYFSETDFEHFKIISFDTNSEYSSLLYNMNLETFLKKNKLISYFPEMKDSYEKLINLKRDYLRNSQESFIIYDTIKNIYVGGAFVYKYDEPIPNYEEDENLNFIYEMMDSMSRPIAMDLLTKGKKVMSTSIATNRDLSFKDNIKIIYLIETTIINVAKRFDYDAILSNNTSELTRDICLKMKGYQLLNELKPNEYSKNGVVLLKNLPDTYKISLCIKYIDKI